MTLAIGQVIDRYTVEGDIGEGGVATVYRVRHNTLGSLHALKVLHFHNPSIRERLVQEGRVQATLKHANVFRACVNASLPVPILPSWPRCIPTTPHRPKAAIWVGFRPATRCLNLSAR